MLPTCIFPFFILAILHMCIYLLTFVLSPGLKAGLTFAVVYVFSNIACDKV